MTLQGPASFSGMCPINMIGYSDNYSVQWTMYYPSGRVSAKSAPYLVKGQGCKRSGDPIPVPYFRPDTSQAATTYAYDGLGRTISTTDALGKTTTTTYATDTPEGANVSDTASYEATTVQDANYHESEQLTDGFGRVRYSETFTGTSPSTYALYGTTATSYDWLGDATSVTGPAPSGAAGLATSPQTTSTYDLAGRMTGMSDADLGNGWTYSYDYNGNLIESVDPRGSATGAIWTAYDGLNRPLWRNSVDNGNTNYASYRYDESGHGTGGIGHLTTERFNPSASLGNGWYSYSYDARGQTSGETVTLDGSSYSFSFGYNDAGQQTSLTYSDGEVLSLNYGSFGWLTSAATTPSGSSTAVNLATNISYSGVGGAAQHPSAASIANGTYSYSASYDSDLRPSSVSLTTTSTQATVFSSSRTYDAVGNVQWVDTTLAAGTDNQNFCYDEQNRLTWAAAYSTAEAACGGQYAPGTLSGGYYSTGHTYDPRNRLVSATGTGGAGTYTYGNSGHLDAATSASSGYGASYDAVGDMLCRAPTSASTCAGSSPTGQQLSYDNERRLIGWQSAPSNPATSITDAYDADGQRVAQSVTTGGTTTTTNYIAKGLEEQTGSTLLKYETVPGVITAEITGTGSSESVAYLATDGLGSVSEALDSSGNVLGAQLYGPYGGVRYSSGTMPTARGYTGQYADAASGLDYYNARYYDPVLGQFTSADTKQGPNRYAYVADNPETATDPTGHRYIQALADLVTDAFNSVNKADTVVSTAYGLGLSAAVRYARAVRMPAGYRYFPYSMGGSKPGFRWIPRSNPSEIAEADNAVSKLRLANFALAGIAWLADAGLTGYSYLQNHPDDPDKFEKAVIAGALHATIVVVATAVVASACGPLAAACAVVTGMVAGRVADAVVNDNTVNTVTNLVNTAGGTLQSGGQTVANAAGSVVSSVGNALGSLFG